MCPPPVATTFVKPAISVGVACSVVFAVVRPSCPLVFLPQETTVPFESKPKPCK
jgi:hypothetical protein